jgi:hypothetical protein
MWLEKDGPFAAWSKLSGTTRFATVVGGGILVLLGAVVASRANARAQRSAGETAAAPSAPDDDMPATITREWCGRLGTRIEPRLTAQAQAKYPGRDVSTVHDYVLNMVNNCLEDVGKPVAPAWRCHWDETFDSSDSCKAMEKAARAEQRRAEKAALEAPSRSPTADDAPSAEVTCACTNVRRWTKAHEWLPTKVQASSNGEFFGEGCAKWDGPFSQADRNEFAKGGPALDKLIAEITALPNKAPPGCAEGWPRKQMLDTAQEIQKARKVWQPVLEKADPSLDDLNKANAATCGIQTRLWKTLDESCGHTEATHDKAKSCGFGCSNWSGTAAATAGRSQEATPGACSKWTTICTLGRFPDGSERTTGAQRFSTKASCERAGADLGVRCDPCRCID